jgi:hypothetical protein
MFGIRMNIALVILKLFSKTLNIGSVLGICAKLGVNHMNKVGITALIPPELIFACGKIPCDVNNYVPNSKIQPANKLCSWTAIWRDMIIKKELSLDYLIVVAGGDCHNALVDGQKAAMRGIPTFYFFYPFEDDVGYLKSQLEKMSLFLGGVEDEGAFEKVNIVKKKGMELDKKRVEGKISASKTFEVTLKKS